MIGHPYAARLSDDRKFIYTSGIDWGRPLQVLFRKGNHYVLRRKGHMTWSYVGGPFEYTGTLYMLVKYEGGTMHIIRKEEPGKKWRTALKTLITSAKTR